MATNASEFRQSRDGLAPAGFQPRSGAPGGGSSGRLRVQLAALAAGLLAAAVVAALLIDSGPGSPARISAGAGPTAVSAHSPATAGTDEQLVLRYQPSWPPAGLPDVERVVWHAGIPTGPGGKATAAPDRSMVVELTFDDGPSPIWTPQILDILHQEGVHATFSLIGYAVVRYGGLARQELATGQAICDHTAHHNEHLDRAPPDVVAMEIDLGADLIKNATGRDPVCYRPPADVLSPAIVATAHQRHLRILSYSLDPSDYRRVPAPVLLERILARVKPGSIIVLHDGGGDRSQTVAMLKPLIDRLKGQGYHFTTPLDEPPTG